MYSRYNAQPAATYAPPSASAAHNQQTGPQPAYHQQHYAAALSQQQPYTQQSYAQQTSRYQQQQQQYSHLPPSSVPPVPRYPQGSHDGPPYDAQRHPPSSSRDGALYPTTAQQRQQQPLGLSGRTPAYQADGTGAFSSAGGHAQSLETESTNASSSSNQQSSRALPTPPPVETLTRGSHSRIDPSYVPRPVFSHEVLTQPGGQRYETDKYTVPPPPYGVYTIKDTGNASCRFMRVSLKQVPTSAETLKASGMPMVLAAQVFPVLGDYEEPVPYVNFNKGSPLVAYDSESEGPPRCTRCRGYISPFLTFPDSASAVCNFCGQLFTLPKHYQRVLYSQSRGRPSAQTVESEETVTEAMPELSKGVVDFAASRAFLQVNDPSATGSSNHPSAHRPHHHAPDNPPSLGGPPGTHLNPETGEVECPAPAFVFAIDCCAAAQQNGLTQTAIQAVRTVCSQITESNTRICILTFDSCIKFYQLPTKTAQQILVVTDIQEPFHPSHASVLCVPVMEHSGAIDDLLNQLPTLINARAPVSGDTGYADPLPLVATQSCGNAALRAAVSLVKSCGGGAVKIFYGTAPDVGAGAIPRAAATAHQSGSSSSPKATYLHCHENLNDFCGTLLGDCINSGTAIDAFIASVPNRHIGVSNMAYLCRKSGGKMCYYGNFSYYRDCQRVCMDLTRQFLLPQGFDCIVKLRVSRGYSAVKMLTPASLGKRDSRIDVFSDPSMFRTPRLDADDTLFYILKNDGELGSEDEHKPLQLQVACLHTTLSGQRKLRVITLSLPTTNALSNTFRYAETETLTGYFVRLCGNNMMNGVSSWRDELVKQLVEILFSYRINCAITTSMGQLILPDALKCLPAYLSGLLKHDAFRTQDMFSDERDYALNAMIHYPLHQMLPVAYPRLYIVHRTKVQTKSEKLQRVGEPAELEGEVYAPPMVACSGEKITIDGIYILDCGTTFKLYFGNEVNPEIIQDIFGAAEITDEALATVDPENLSGNMGGVINRCIAQLRKVKGLAHPWQPVEIVRPRSIEESKMTWRLVEDKLGSEPSYPDFLCQLHRAVHARMEDA